MTAAWKQQVGTAPGRRRIPRASLLVRFGIVSFVLVGAFLERSGAGQLFVDLAYCVTGRSWGGAAKAAEAPNGQHNYVNSPFVGTFYRSPSPEAPSFVEVGQRVKKGQVICIVEAMKLMNEIEAEADGTVVACLVENAQPVEYAQALFKISPASS